MHSETFLQQLSNCSLSDAEEAACGVGHINSAKRSLALSAVTIHFMSERRHTRQR